MPANRKKVNSSPSGSAKAKKVRTVKAVKHIKNSSILSKALQKAKLTLLSGSPKESEIVTPKNKSVLRPSSRVGGRSLGVLPNRPEGKQPTILQEEVSRTKFETGQEVQENYYEHLPQNLPASYGDDKIVLQIRDPWWVHTYWEVQPSTVDSIRQRFGHEFNGAKPVLRVYDVSYIIFDGTNAHKFFDIDIPLEAKNWYLDLGGPGQSWCVDIGFRLADGRFIMIARSNVVMMPIDGPSWQTDEEWMIPEELFARLYHLGFGLNPSSPVGKEMSQRFRFPVTSWGVTSPSSPVGAPWSGQGRKPFWLVVNTELIVYGATEPDAKVTVKGQPLRLNPDGTFSLRFSLPDGRQVIPVEAHSSDGSDVRSVTPVVSKETH